MKEFKGSAEEFKEIISNRNLSGSWSETGNGLRFNCNTGGIINWFQSTGTIQFQGRKDAQDHLKETLTNANGSKNSIININKNPVAEINKRVFVVHGHDSTSREQLELIISQFGLEPFVLAKTSGGGLNILDALTKEITGNGNSEFGVVLLTPDDFGYAIKDGETHAKHRARQNAILELGMLIAKVGQSNTVIIVKGQLELPSDIDGILRLEYATHVKEISTRLAERLISAGYNIDATRIIKAAS